MVKRLQFSPVRAHLLPSPSLLDAPVMDLMCSHFVLTLVARQGAHFNERRDMNGIVGLAGQHLVWPASALARIFDPTLLRQRTLAWPRSAGACSVFGLPRHLARSL